jgi:hypothetical protein
VNNFKLLKWDSEVFQFPVARITEPNLNVQSLKSSLKKLKDQNVRLVYWAPKSLDNKSCHSAEKLGGLFVGINRTYCCEISLMVKLKNKTQIQLNPVNNSYRNNLIELILRRAISTRFFKDERIRETYYGSIITQWIDDSINNNVGFIYTKSDSLIGYISLNEKNSLGNIDYIIVDDKLATPGLGSQLLEYGHSWFIDNKYSSVIAITQKENISACKMYEKFGYRVINEESYYHFWI